MIQVSNEFKKAIKEPERRMKGYVEVLYDLPNITVTPSVNATSTYTPTSEISNGVRVENLYGSVDYLPLDGSYITMSDTNTNIGYISDELFENLTSPTITLSFARTSINGITLYFRENPPTNITLRYSDTTRQTIINEENIIQVIFDEPKTLTRVSIIINDMMYHDRKIYLMEADLGITQVYKDRDLIEFTVDEEVNKLIEEIPINETNITINNMSDLFNPLNPKGIVPYLSENTLIKPYIGVLTETQGVEYVKMGEFYFDSYTNNSDATTTLVGKNLIKKLENETLKNDNETNIFVSGGLPKSTFEQFMENYDYDKDLSGYGNFQAIFDLRYINSDKLIDLLKDMAFYETNLLYFDRNSTLKLVSPNYILQDTINKYQLIEDTQYKNITKINYLIIEKPYWINATRIEAEDAYTETFELEETTKYVAIKTNTMDFYGNIIIEQSGGTSASIVCHGYFLAFIKITGAIGNTVTIKVKKVYNVKETTLVTNSLLKVRNKNTLVFNTRLHNNYLKFDILKNMPSYEMSFEYNGDPSLEAGDYINVETPYGYKPLFIQKNRFVFDGGLTGSIEGVE